LRRIQQGAPMGPIGIPELIIILVILLVIFGPKRLPGIGKSLGTGMREFKDSISGKDAEDERDATGRELPPAPSSSAVSIEKDEQRVHEPRS
jgi:sec-independent protein translocase protein TatA